MLQQLSRATIASTGKWGRNLSRSAPDLPGVGTTPARDRAHPWRDASPDRAATRPRHRELPNALAGLPERPLRLRQLLIFSPGGSQGGAVAAQALQNAEQGRFSVLLRPRSRTPATGSNLVSCGARVVDVANHPNAGMPTGPLELDPAETLVIDPTVVGGLHHTIAQTPLGSTVVYLQNGMPSHAAEKAARGIRAHDMISMVPASRQPGEGVSVTPGGVMLVDANDPLTETLHSVLQGQSFFRLQNVPDIRVTRYEKVALNCALNVTATLFGKTLGELQELSARDARCGKLIAGLAGEVCALARAMGVPVRPDDQIMGDIHAAMERFSHHPTSMRAAFDAGLETEIEVLNAGVSREGRRRGVPTPLNDLVSGKLALYEGIRRACGNAGDFHQRHPPLVQRTVDDLLAAADRLA